MGTHFFIIYSFNLPRGHPTRPCSLIGIAVCHARSLLLKTERKEDSQAIFPSNLEQTRVYFREMESLDDPLTAPRAPCLLIDNFGKAISIPPLCGLLQLRLLLRLSYTIVDHTASKQCLEHRPGHCL